MNKGNLVTLLLLLIAGVTGAAVYKWVDESGGVHYGDRPSKGSNAQSVPTPKGPSQEEIDRARQQMREKIDQYGEFSRESSPPESVDKPPRQVGGQVVSPDNVACFTSLSDLVTGPSAETYTPISPSTLTKAQRGLLVKMFGEADARLLWRGTITDLQCNSKPSASEPDIQITNFEAQTTMRWDALKSRLTIETDTIGKESGVTKRLVHRFEVGDALYFADFATVGSMTLEGNKVELLKLSQNRLLFLIKRRNPPARQLRGEVVYLEISGRLLKLIELYYYNDMLTESRTWVLGR